MKKVLLVLFLVSFTSAFAGGFNPGLEARQTISELQDILPGLRFEDCTGNYHILENGTSGALTNTTHLTYNCEQDNGTYTIDVVLGFNPKYIKSIKMTFDREIGSIK